MDIVVIEDVQSLLLYPMILNAGEIRHGGVVHISIESSANCYRDHKMT